MCGEFFLYESCWMIDPLIMGEVRSFTEQIIWNFVMNKKIDILFFWLQKIVSP